MESSLYFPPWQDTLQMTRASEDEEGIVAEEPAVVVELRRELTDWLEWLSAQAQAVKGLQALLLAGGYGRGEGGVWWPPTNAKPQLYNDMEFYIFAPGLAAQQLKAWIHEGEARLGIEMEFKVMSPGSFSKAEPSMFYYDLLKGHVCVAGSAQWVNTLPARLSDPKQIPAVEASRLLINRGISLLRCLRWAQGERELEVGFCDRIVAKLQMALGDAVLCAHGDYHWSCRQRNEKLSQVQDAPPDWQAIVSNHHKGVAYKFRPTLRVCEPKDWLETLLAIQQQWQRTFLWLESRRLGIHFKNPRNYANYKGRVFPAEPAWKNLLRQIRDFRHSPRLPFSACEHPRARVWRSLLALMGGDTCTAKEQLGCNRNGVELEESCRSAWQRYP
jgi:hypothetical protein